MSGEAATPDREDMLAFATVAAIDAGHHPKEVRTWSEGDLVRYAIYNYET